jgi:hypothetical protein
VAQRPFIPFSQHPDYRNPAFVGALINAFLNPNNAQSSPIPLPTNGNPVRTVNDDGRSEVNEAQGTNDNDNSQIPYTVP